MSGKLVIFSAPSGAGKTTIVRSLLKENFKLEFSVSACTRDRRPNEIHGKDYYFITPDAFREKIKNNEFIEWEEVYSGCFYGTLKTEIDRISSEGKNILFDVDVVGGLNIKNLYGDRALSVFVMPPSLDELEKRLMLRNTDDIAVVKKRLAKAGKELEYAKKFDKIIINDKLPVAIDEARNLLNEFLAIQ